MRESSWPKRPTRPSGDRGRGDRGDVPGEVHRAVDRPGDAAVERHQQHRRALLLEQDGEGQGQRHRRDDLDRRPLHRQQRLPWLQLGTELHAHVEHHQDADHDADEEVHDLQEAGGGGDVVAGQTVLHARDQRPSGQQREEATRDDRGGAYLHMGELEGDPYRGGRHRGHRELVELRQPAPGEDPRHPVTRDGAERRRHEDHEAAADQHGGATGQQPGRQGQRPGVEGVPVPADLRQPPVRLLQRHLGVVRADVVHQPVHRRQPRVVRPAAGARYGRPSAGRRPARAGTRWRAG